VFERRRPLAVPVTFTLDGRPFEAERGEPLAVALLASGEGTIARSPKLHRPRGPACLRGDCDGCLARVDGVPNVMTCLREARGGEAAETQNVLGSRTTDLLRLTDWFFPKGIDHHHLMAGVPGVQAVMQGFARRMAGIGRLPDVASPPKKAERLDCDVLIVGGGLAGLACAAELVKAKKRVLVVDDGALPGGSASFAGKKESAAAAELAGLLPDGTVLSHTACVGFYDRDALLSRPEGAAVITPRATVIATGAHDGILTVDGNDVPGVMSARAVCKLAARDIVPKDETVIVGETRWAGRAESALEGRKTRRVQEGDVAEILGSSKVEGLKLKSGEEIACCVVAVATRCAPSFELAAQRGAETRRHDAGFSVLVDGSGKAADALWAVGEVTGVELELDSILDQARRAADAIVKSVEPSLQGG
jgi:sarcosine oxidase, subunit alpha